jgi:tol-pal system protein YbgF
MATTSKIVGSARVRRARRMTWLLSLSGALALLAAGCASEVDLSSLRKEQRDLARRLADTRADVESLRVQLSRLRAQVEEGRSRARATAPAPSSSYASSDIEERLRVLESRSGEPSATPPSEVTASVPPGSEFEPSAPSASAPPPVTSRVSDTGSPVPIEADMGRSTSEEYRTGLALVQRGEGQKAVQTLRGLVNKNPKSDIVPYAQYWIGEAYFDQGKYNEAILAYNEVLVGWPKSDRVPAALLRQATAFAELGDKIDARLILQKLISEHPASPEAARAKRQLMALGN